MMTMSNDTLVKLLAKAYSKGASDQNNKKDTTDFEAERVAKEILKCPFKVISK